MNDAPVQVIVAAFSDPDAANTLMDELKQGKKDGLIGIQDAAVVVKDADGKLKITDSRRRSRRRRGLITGGVVGGLVGLLAGPVGWAALGGGAVGALVGRVKGMPMRATMGALGDSMTPNSSAIVAVVEHTWVSQLQTALMLGGAYVVTQTIAADIAAQLQAGGNVVYTAIDGTDAAGVVRMAESPDGVRVSGIISSSDGVSIGDAEFTDEQPADDESTEPVGDERS